MSIGIKKKQEQANGLFAFLLEYQKIILVMISIIILLMPVIKNTLQEQPLIQGKESYYLLSLGLEQRWTTTHQGIANLLTLLPTSLLIFLPLILGIIALLSLHNILEKTDIDKGFRFLFPLFFIISPIYIVTFNTLSPLGVTFAFSLLGFAILLKNNNKTRFLALIPFAIATASSLPYSILLLIFQLYYIYTQKGNNKTKYIFPLMTVFLTLLNSIFFYPAIINNGKSQQIIENIIADLGTGTGISFFLFIIGVMGILLLWRKKEYAFSYLSIIITTVLYAYDNTILIVLALHIAFFAAFCFLMLLERQWVLETVRQLSLLLLLLGLLFSTLAFLSRVSAQEPSANEREALEWTSQNTPPDAIVFSFPENAYYISAIAYRIPFSTPSDKKENATTAIFNAKYIQELFPLLEQNNITLLFISEEMYASLPKENGLLFLLKNERFKLIYSRDHTEVWIFKPKEPERS